MLSLSLGVSRCVAAFFKWYSLLSASAYTDHCMPCFSDCDTGECNTLNLSCKLTTFTLLVYVE